MTDLERQVTRARATIDQDWADARDAFAIWDLSREQLADMEIALDPDAHLRGLSRQQMSLVGYLARLALRQIRVDIAESLLT